MKKVNIMIKVSIFPVQIRIHRAFK